MDSGTSTSTGLLQRAMLREEGAWDKLSKLYGKLVYVWCRQRGLQANDAENVGQEVFMRVLEKLPSFRGPAGGGSFRAWIRQIAQNCMVDHLRGQDPAIQPTGGTDAQELLAQLPDPATPERQQLSEDQALLLKEALDLLHGEFSPRDVDVFTQLELFGRKPGEVAAAMHLKIGAVYTIRSRIRQRMRDEFTGLLDL